MVGVIVDAQRLRRSQVEFKDLHSALMKYTGNSLSELKGVDLYRGRNDWRKVRGETRGAIIDEICTWFCDQKHSLALASINRELFEKSEIKKYCDDDWLVAALHIALQIQKSNQKIKRNKGRTILVFDDNRIREDKLSQLLFDPPDWSDDFYGKSAKQGKIDQIIDTPFFGRSHHIGLVQIADFFAYLLRRYFELEDLGLPEQFPGEREYANRRALQLGSRLIAKSLRWPKGSKCSGWYHELAPKSLLTLG